MLKSSMNRTAFSKVMGYSSTGQLAATMEGKGLISTKAVILLRHYLNVKPMFLFSGKGEMHLTSENEIYKQKNQILSQNYETTVKTFMELNRIIKMKQHYSELIDITSATIKYTKEEPSEDKESSFKSK